MISFYCRYIWKRKLLKLDKYRPKLGRPEYIERLTIKGFKRKYIKVVYDEIKRYLSLNEFSMYCDDNISKYYLREQSDITIIIENIYIKLKIDSSKRSYKLQDSYPFEYLTITSLLNLLCDEN